MSFANDGAVYPDDLASVFPVFRVDSEHYLRVLCLRVVAGLRAGVV